MFIAIANAIGAGKVASYISKLIKNFKTRVLLASGIFEAEACLVTLINELKNIPYTPPTPPSLILNQLSVSSAAAYSLRLLKNNYTGSAIRVRRSSDNSETDIGFVNGELDTATLLSFIGGGNGFVTTWYDQSGNGRHATQTTAANQPRIVNAGVVETMGGKPSIYMNGAKFLDVSLGSTVATGMHYNLAYRLFGFQDSYMFSMNGPTAFLNDGNRAGARLSMRNDSLLGYTDITGIRDTNPHVAGWGWNGSTAQRYFDGVASGGSGSVGGTLTLSTLRIGFNQATLNAWQSEAILFETDLSTSDRQTLEQNQGQFYGITVI